MQALRETTQLQMGHEAFLGLGSFIVLCRDNRVRVRSVGCCYLLFLNGVGEEELDWGLLIVHGREMGVEVGRWWGVRVLKMVCFVLEKKRLGLAKAGLPFWQARAGWIREAWCREVRCAERGVL